MGKTTAVLGGFIVMTVLACALLAYLWIDRSISLSYARQSLETAENTIAGLESLLEREWQGMPETDILQKLQEVAYKRKPETIVKREGNTIWFDEIPLNFEQGRLTSIGAP